MTVKWPQKRKSFPLSPRVHVNDYVTSIFASNILDPDGGVYLQRKRISLGLDEEIVPFTDENFPDSGFQVGISGIPQLDIHRYENI